MQKFICNKNVNVKMQCEIIECFVISNGEESKVTHEHYNQMLINRVNFYEC